MATPARHLCRSLRQISRKTPAKRKWVQIQHGHQAFQQTRPFASTFLRKADESRHAGAGSSGIQDGATGEGLDEAEYLTPKNPYTAADLSPAERADYELMSKEDQKQYLKLQNHFKAIFESDETDQELSALADQVDRDIDREGGPEVALDFQIKRPLNKDMGYWGEDEADEFGAMEDGDDDFSPEHISSVAQSEVDLHRDVREYMRMAAWDLPLLQKYAKPFQPPNHSTPLRFRYTTYMGEVHPAQHKVVLEFCSKDLLQNTNASHKLTEPQRQKLLKLVGVRYNPDTDVVKMSCEKFPSAAQNKRYLGELLAKLIKESKDKRDMFEDVALDLRHHKSKKAPLFPDEWKLSGKTMQKVLEARQEMKLLGGGEDAEPVNGRKLVEQYVRVGAMKVPSALT